MNNPVIEYRTLINDSGSGEYVNRLLIGTAVTGLVRVEWVGARYGQVIPVNWSQVTLQQFMNSYMPLRYQVADAQNLIIKEAIDKEFEWLLLFEHDVLPPADAMIRLNRYIIDASAPIVSGLYFTRSRPAEPLLFRGRGTGFYDDWKLGDIVWVDGVPTGFLLIHVGILKLIWDESPEYLIRHGQAGTITRQVFETPRRYWTDPESNSFYTTVGTSDLDWCSRVIEGDYIRRAGWEDYWDGLEDKRWPLFVDTNIFCRHIDPDGTQYPTDVELRRWQA